MKKIVADPPYVLTIRRDVTFNEALQQAAIHMRAAASAADEAWFSDAQAPVMKTIMPQIDAARLFVEWADSLQRKH